MERVKQLYAFVDECGTDSLNLTADHVDHYFICVATLVEKKDIELIDEQIFTLKKSLGMQPEHELK